jgi:hypothetical protein
MLERVATGQHQGGETLGIPATPVIVRSRRHYVRCHFHERHLRPPMRLRRAVPSPTDEPGWTSTTGPRSPAMGVFGGLLHIASVLIHAARPVAAVSACSARLRRGFSRFDELRRESFRQAFADHEMRWCGEFKPAGSCVRAGQTVRCARWLLPASARPNTATVIATRSSSNTVKAWRRHAPKPLTGSTYCCHRPLSLRRCRSRRIRAQPRWPPLAAT